MSIEKLITEINAAGLKVNNLFQYDEAQGGLWQANVRDGKSGYEFGKGTTPVEALKNCFDNAKKSIEIKYENGEDLV